MKNLPILYKMAVALGGTIGLSIIGFILTITFIQTSLRKQLASQSQSELAVFALNFAQRLRQDSGNKQFAPLIRKNKTDEERNILNQSLNKLAREQKVDYVILLDPDRKVISSTSNLSAGKVYDPDGLVTKSLVRGESITSYASKTYEELQKTFPQLSAASPNALVRFDIQPINDSEDFLVGLLVIVNVIETAELPIVDTTTRNIGNGLAIVTSGTNTVVLGSMLRGEDTTFIDELPPELAQIELTAPSVTLLSAWVNQGAANSSPIAANTLNTQELLFKDKRYTISYAPILNVDGNPVGMLVRGTPQDNLNVLIRETVILVIYTAIGLFVLGTVFTIGVARLVSVPTRKLQSVAQKYINGDLSERASIDSQDEIGVLANVFNQMADSIQQRQADEIAARSEVEAQSMVLEEEVGKLLGVVSDLELGDLTVEAEVSDQATGLVADTLNRLIEQLGNTVATVLSTARQVNRSAETLEELAIAVALNAQEQVGMVEQASEGMINVNELAQGASEQALLTGTALASAQTAVQQGQSEIVQLTTSINSLQTGTEEMVKRIKSLGEFVDLAKQFVQDQKRLASLTQVLAMNASMVAARAVEQREPDQFATVAREFEAIAAQVNKLASQTSQGLALLQQRTGFIEIVVSGINQDVADVSNLVLSFTNSVEETNQAFVNIKTVTEEVSNLGQAVTESSQSIAEAVKISFDSIKNIASAAERSAEQSNFTRQQSTEMGEMARLLLENVQFFRLPPEKIAEQPLLTGKS